MKTITLQIGNSDDKLTQAEWAEFVDAIDDAINRMVGGLPGELHFSGGSANCAKWQNYCWVFTMTKDPTITSEFKRAISGIRIVCRQKSVAWTEGETSFI
jgi:hypothetical protein